MVISIPSILIGLAVGAGGVLGVNFATKTSAKAEAKKVLDEANNQAKNTVKQAVLDGKTQVYDLKLQAEKESKSTMKKTVKQEKLKKDMKEFILAK